VYAWLEDGGTLCNPAPVHVRPIGEPLGQVPLWSHPQPSDPCTPYTGTLGPAYHLGDELPPTAFAEITTTVD
jgi:hypothetical protein